ncbi:2-succinyl-5-enolpyruvyl-6-hydroxy-3-cyclohexene- 1-carboxylate synthase [Aurantimicrobium sp. INA4]|uniref:2-succinyl-5-enolpyruvyl-6-hydroxy-3- cyclohexene-1-carboxylic-acid synthase n=1 Tax=Aurantimicrobium sp. INA4 TaxID=2986279 RepID=UPI00248FBAA0|nr:2-succinyl-5-enolpyruvyl-6-hydroxy-3-cyclohexene-1-carboxylic-acid synthase [Aurantimicrobium sp. INA4]BDU11520.1 2-succinyl-5-enolpyruvyl-6-hydroxy-3-cyclohexene- 1-carboxylate synthase [Aurantimicrobium sp. INA4]
MSKAAPSSVFAAEFLPSLIELGVEHIVLAPGSRSQALALVAAELERRGDVKLHVRIDERVAGFVALGIAVESSTPAVVITTSGSAVANLHPAVLEAHHAGVPMIVVTADRPEELREIGSNQTTHQHDIFGPAVRFSIDEPAPAPGATVVRRAHELAEQAWRVATNPYAPGPVHLNLAFREPLSSPIDLRPVGAQSRDAHIATESAITVQLARGPRTIVIAGADAGPRAEEVAHEGGWPLIAEVTSGSRYGRNLVPAYRQLLSMPELTSQIERIIVFGHPTLSREVPAIIADSTTGIETIVVRGQAPEGYNPGLNVASFVNQVEVEPGETDQKWLGLWIQTGREVFAEIETISIDAALATAPNISASRSESIEDKKAFLKAEVAAARVPLNRELLVDAVWRATWPHDRLVFGASRLIRVADKFVGGKKITVHANRGLAGIDGNIGTGIGIALAAEGALTRIVVGDLAALHDAGSFLFGENEIRPRVQVIVGNDGGGTIFDALEVGQTAPAESMDRVFLTPQVVDFHALAAAYGWNFTRVTTVSEFERALTATGEGPEIIEVVLSR